MTWDKLFETYNDDLNNINKEIQLEQTKYENQLQIYPPINLRFAAFDICAFENLKICILGQDPYHSEGQAMGLSFSVPSNMKTPPSLRNIFKELQNDLGINRTNPDLTDWATQGILLLNTALSVREHCPNSHSKIWKSFGNNVIKFISDNKQDVIFILWGKYAQSKSNLIDITKHYILCANHPSPMSANRGGFFGNKHFSKANEILRNLGKKEIAW
jgi:uracil-DNA glycosylase|tara:strand:- start:343 stop:990 length:648 start_codon:yes stop_codon:yes gene_type:complete